MKYDAKTETLPAQKTDDRKRFKIKTSTQAESSGGDAPCTTLVW